VSNPEACHSPFAGINEKPGGMATAPILEQLPRAVTRTMRDGSGSRSVAASAQGAQAIPHALFRQDQARSLGIGFKFLAQGADMDAQVLDIGFRSPDRGERYFRINDRSERRFSQILLVQASRFHKLQPHPK
jgi:hypothetical protein